MYNDLKKLYWWSGMKRDIFEFVTKCLICQQVKAEHQVPSGLLQPVMVPKWKWDRITMDFVTGLPMTPKKKDAMWVIVDRLTKSAHFKPIKKNVESTLTVEKERFWTKPQIGIFCIECRRTSMGYEDSQRIIHTIHLFWYS
ncbi:integrase [Gossypium australe]|uniref:Integrase n=1 Tax=Gossypium australe TaxID=47621 RepID=A0A5B6WPI3_9ROSI|nr:integrase [Gossypium australe]